MWLSVIAPVLAFAGGLAALALSGRAEALKLRSQHRSEEQRKLRTLSANTTGDSSGRRSTGTGEWVRCMRAGKSSSRAGAPGDAVSVMEKYLEDEHYFEHPDPVRRTYGKFCSRDEYFFRSFVYRLVSLCAIARRFESQAFFIDSQVARPADFGFLKYAKSFLWAMTTSDLPYGPGFPNYDHIPSDYLRPVLDSCYRESDEATAASADASRARRSIVFDLARPDSLIERERHSVAITLQRNQANRALTVTIAAAAILPEWLLANEPESDEQDAAPGTFQEASAGF